MAPAQALQGGIGRWQNRRKPILRCRLNTQDNTAHEVIGRTGVVVCTKGQGNLIGKRVTLTEAISAASGALHIRGRERNR